MSQIKDNPIANVFKYVVVAFFRLLAVSFAFVFRILATILIKLSEILEKASGNGGSR